MDGNPVLNSLLEEFMAIGYHDAKMENINIKKLQVTQQKYYNIQKSLQCRWQGSENEHGRQVMKSKDENKVDRAIHKCRVTAVGEYKLRGKHGQCL